MTSAATSEEPGASQPSGTSHSECARERHFLEDYETFVQGSNEQPLSVANMDKMTAEDTLTFQFPAELRPGAFKIHSWSTKLVPLGSSYLNDASRSIPCKEDLKNIGEKAVNYFSQKQARSLIVEWTGMCAVSCRR